jgi:hypothetical protein
MKLAADANVLLSALIGGQAMRVASAPVNSMWRCLPPPLFRLQPFRAQSMRPLWPRRGNASVGGLALMVRLKVYIAKAVRTRLFT